MQQSKPEEQNVCQRVHLPEILWITFSPSNLDFCRALLHAFFTALQTHLKVFENSGGSVSYRLKFRGILQQSCLVQEKRGGGGERTGWKVNHNNMSCFLLSISAWTEKEFTRYLWTSLARQTCSYQGAWLDMKACLQESKEVLISSRMSSFS